MGWTPPRGGGGGGGFSVDVQGLKLDLHIEKRVPEGVADALIACDVDQRHGGRKKNKKGGKDVCFVRGRQIRSYFLYFLWVTVPRSVQFRLVSSCIVLSRIVSYRHVSYRHVSYRHVSYRIVSPFVLLAVVLVCVCVCVCVCVLFSLWVPVVPVVHRIVELLHEVIALLNEVVERER